MPFVTCNWDDVQSRDFDGCNGCPGPCWPFQQDNEKRLLATGRMYRGVMIVRTQAGAYIQRESDFQMITFLNEEEAMLFVDAYYTLFGGARELVSPEESMLKA